MRRTPAEIKQYIFVIRELTARELKRKYARSSLGVLWSVLNPLLHMIVISLIFSTMFRRNIEHFPIYYLTGNLFWSLFTGATNSSMSSLVDNKSLLIKTKLPKRTFILSRIYTAVMNFGYSCIAYVMMLVVFRIAPSRYLLLLPVSFICTLLLSLGVGYMLSVTFVFFADIKYLYSVFTQLLMYLCALFYPVERLPEAMQAMLGYNPVYLPILFARTCVLQKKMPEGWIWSRMICISLAFYVIGRLVFRNKQNRVMETI